MYCEKYCKKFDAPQFDAFGNWIFDAFGNLKFDPFGNSKLQLQLGRRVNKVLESCHLF